MISFQSAWHQAMGLMFPCLPEERKLDRCELCGWLFTPFDDWNDQVHTFDGETGTFHRFCKHHPELGTTIVDCESGQTVTMLPHRPKAQRWAHEATYWLFVVARFVWLCVSYWARIAWVKLAHPERYRSWKEFMEGE